MKKLLILSLIVIGINFVSNARTCFSSNGIIRITCECSQIECVHNANMLASLIK